MDLTARVVKPHAAALTEAALLAGHGERPYRMEVSAAAAASKQASAHHTTASLALTLSRLPSPSTHTLSRLPFPLHSFQAILVLRLIHGRDFYVTCAAEWRASIMGLRLRSRLTAGKPLFMQAMDASGRLYRSRR